MKFTIKNHSTKKNSKVHMTSEQFKETLRAIMQIPHKLFRIYRKRQFITHFMELILILIPILYKNIREKTNTYSHKIVNKSNLKIFSSSW